ncbi:MAG: DUF4386 domain-containing protein [Alphaproteobacteria bacterium]|nr:DUF4386 domain-containing protein [Alphaproteobacteria bacterium]
MTSRLDERPQLYARSAGALYLLVIVFGAFSEGYLRGLLVVPGDAAATVARIVAKPDLWRLGVAANLVVPLIAIVQLWLEYLLLRPAGRNLALLFVLLNAASLAVEAVSKVFELMVLPLAAGGGDPHGLAAMALLGHDMAFNVALIFFGAACLVSGTLIFRSAYLPRALGILMQVAGASYLVVTASSLFAPKLADVVSPMAFALILSGEGSLCLWLLIMGVRRDRWALSIA